MAFENHYPNRKDRRRPYHGAKASFGSCRPGGSCKRCAQGRQKNKPKRKGWRNNEE